MNNRDSEFPLVGPGGVGSQPIEPAQSPTVSETNPGPPTAEPVSARKMFKSLGFDPDGNTELMEFLRTPYTARHGQRLASESKEKTEEQIRKRHFSRSSRTGGAADAFRHAYWSYRMAQEIGPDAAKRFGDAHEISHPNPTRVRLMDLFNNSVRRRLALVPGNKDRPPEEVIREAIGNGQMQTRPFKTRFSANSRINLRRPSQ